MEQLLREITVRIVDAVWADGGQRRARRNAWQAMVDDNTRARLRAEAEAAVEAAARSAQTGASHGATPF